VVLDQRVCERRPHVAGVAEAVQHHDRGPLAADAHIDRRTIRFDHLRPHADEFFNLRRGGHDCAGRNSKHCENVERAHGKFPFRLCGGDG
jgi:hypothetical protein